MTRGKKLMALLLALVVLVAAAALALTQNGEEEAVAEVYPVLNDELSNVTELSWQHGDTQLNFYKDGSAWIYAEDTAFPTSGGAISNLLSALTGMTYEKAIPDVEQLGDYGLDAPVCTMVLNGVHSISFGDVNALGDARYVTVDGSTVYLVDKSVVSNFLVELYDLVQTEPLPYIYTVSDVTVERGKDDLILRKETVEDEDVWHGLSGAEQITLDSELAEDFADTVTGIYWNGCVDYKADTKALRSYGLHKPQAVLTVGYTESEQVETTLTDENGEPLYDTVITEHSFVLELGHASENGVYARLPGSSMVYEISNSFADEILHTTLTDLMPSEETEE